MSENLLKCRQIPSLSDETGEGKTPGHDGDDGNDGKKTKVFQFYVLDISSKPILYFSLYGKNAVIPSFRHRGVR